MRQTTAALVTTTQIKPESLCAERKFRDLRAFSILPVLAQLAIWSTPALAQVPTDTEKALDRTEKALEQEQGLAAETKAALQELLKALRAERAQAAGAKTDVGNADTSKAPETKATPAPSSAPSRFKVSGDFRLRHESSFKLDDQPTRNRQRARFRIGGTYQATDEVVAGVRLSTGTRLDANSPHVTLGEAFHRFETSPDRVYLAYKPKRVPGLTATAGKFAHPFWANPVYGELVWDADVQLEGIALNYSRKGSGAIERWDFSIGEYLLLEQALRDSRAFVAQAAVHGKMGKNWKPSLALDYYRYDDLTPNGAQGIIGENAGNATSGAAPNLDFASRFSIVNPIAALRYDTGKYPLVISTEYIKNTDAAIPQDSGWAIGATIGSARKKGDWRGYYQWQKVGQDDLPNLQALQDKYVGKGFSIIGITADSDLKAMRRITKTAKVNYPVLRSPPAVLESYKVVRLPTMVLVGRDGRIIKRYGPGVDKKIMGADIEQALSVEVAKASEAEEIKTAAARSGQ